MLIRKPHVAGSFYPADSGELKQFCEPLERPVPEKLIAAKAVILPHAGYIYSGYTAFQVLTRIRIPAVNLMIGPDHRQQGGAFSVYARGQWETPLGKVRIHEPLAEQVLRGAPMVRDNPDAHSFEHSLEVLMPFLQIKNPSAEVVPIIAGTLDIAKAKEAAIALGEILARQKEEILLVVSNDMSHYEDEKSTRKKDQFALEAIENLDADALAVAVKNFRITMCGFIPVYILLVMAEKIGITQATLMDYRTSADATGDRDRVVGYAGFIFE